MEEEEKKSRREEEGLIQLEAHRIKKAGEESTSTGVCVFHK